MKTIDVHAGEMVDVAPTPPPPAPSETVPLPVPATPPPPPPPVVRREIEHPFSPSVLAIGGGLTLAAGIATTALYLDESAAWDRARRDGHSAADDQSYNNTRTGAYIVLTGAVALATATAGLAAWYFLGTRTREVVVTPAGVAGRF